MVSKRLMGAWAFLDFCLFAAGAITVTFSIVWRAPNILMNMVFSTADLNGGLALGIMLLVTFVISVFGVIQKNHITMGLAILNWTLVADAIAVIFVGSWMWFYTLQERNNFHREFAALTPANRIFIQDKFQCCGYFNSTDLAEVGGTFCQNTTFIQTTNNATGNFCVGPITGFADTSLNEAFTTVYGFMAIVLSLFIATLCVINKRLEDERFKKIDAKRGGRGFV